MFKALNTAKGLRKVIRSVTFWLLLIQLVGSRLHVRPILVSKACQARPERLEFCPAGHFSKSFKANYLQFFNFESTYLTREASLVHFLTWPELRSPEIFDFKA